MFKSDDEVNDDDDLHLRSVKKRYFVSNRKQSNRAIFFTVNGQVHGDKGLSFIKNRCDKYHTAPDTIVMVDFSDLGPAQLTDLFTPARDRLQDKPMAKRLESGMEDLLTNDPMLVEEEKRRRQRFTQDKRAEKMTDMLEELIQQNDELVEYLDSGNKVSIDSLGDGDTEETTEYEAPFFPDTLVPIYQGDLWEKDERFEIDIPVNRDGYVSFFMNAPNNFFTRDDRPGNIILEPQELVRSHGITDGTWTIQLTPFEAATPGMTIPVSLDVGAEDMDPLSVQFNVNYTEPVEEEESSSSSADDGALREKVDFPPVVPVYEDQWDEHHENWDEHTPVRLAPGDEMTLFVNFDAAPIKNFMRRHKLRTTGKDMVKETWRVGVAMYAVSTYIEVENEFSPGRIQPDHVTEVSMRGIVQSMLDQQISEEELEALTV
jgi:hypothetical protein